MRWLSSDQNGNYWDQIAIPFRFVSTTKADWLRGTDGPPDKLSINLIHFSSAIARCFFNPNRVRPDQCPIKILSSSLCRLFDRHLWFVRTWTFIDKLGDFVGIDVVFVWYLHHKCPLKYIFLYLLMVFSLSSSKYSPLFSKMMIWICFLVFLGGWSREESSPKGKKTFIVTIPPRTSSRAPQVTIKNQNQMKKVETPHPVNLNHCNFEFTPLFQWHWAAEHFSFSPILWCKIKEP